MNCSHNVCMNAGRRVASGDCAEGPRGGARVRPDCQVAAGGVVPRDGVGQVVGGVPEQVGQQAQPAVHDGVPDGRRTRRGHRDGQGGAHAGRQGPRALPGRHIRLGCGRGAQDLVLRAQGHRAQRRGRHHQGRPVPERDQGLRVRCLHLGHRRGSPTCLLLDCSSCVSFLLQRHSYSVITDTCTSILLCT